jgi:cation:H+ antiporter
MALPWLSVAIILVSLVALERGANYLVEGLGALSERFSISEAVVGASVAAVGSSMPEFGAAVFSVVEGHPTIGFGTIIGSAIFNVTVIVGGSALFGKIAIDHRVVRRDGLFYGLTVLVAIAATWDGQLTRLEAVGWVLLFLVYLGWLLYDARVGEPVPVESALDHTLRRSVGYTVGGLVVVGIAARYLIVHVAAVSAELGVSKAIFSLVVIAIGTSIPDLVTSLQAARYGLGSLAVANALGSNIFDILGALGIPFSFRAVTPIEASLDLSILMLLVAVVAAVGLLRWRWSLSRLEGGLLAGVYGVYLVVLLV